MTIPSNCLTPAGLSKSQTVSLRALPKGLLGTDRPGHRPPLRQPVPAPGCPLGAETDTCAQL